MALNVCYNFVDYYLNKRIEQIFIDLLIYEYYLIKHKYYKYKKKCLSSC